MTYPIGWVIIAVYAEDGVGLADIVNFPCFLFAVELSIPYAIERRYAKGFSARIQLLGTYPFPHSFALLVVRAFITNSEFRLHRKLPHPMGYTGS